MMSSSPVRQSRQWPAWLVVVLIVLVLAANFALGVLSASRLAASGGAPPAIEYQYTPDAGPSRQLIPAPDPGYTDGYGR